MATYGSDRDGFDDDGAKLFGAVELGSSDSGDDDDDDDDLKVVGTVWETAELDVRHGFVRKVLGIVVTQLAATLLCIVALRAVDGAAAFVVDHPWSVWASFVAAVTLLVALFCVGGARLYPLNYVLLAGFTLSIGFTTATVTLFYDTTVVAKAVAITAAITLSLVVFASQVKYDFTGWGPFLLVGLVGLTGFGVVLLFVPGSDTADTAYAALSALLFGIYLVYDVQMVVGGKHRKYQYEVDDYILAAIGIYLDVINLFLSVLALLGRRG